MTAAKKNGAAAAAATSGAKTNGATNGASHAATNGAANGASHAATNGAANGASHAATNGASSARVPTPPAATPATQTRSPFSIFGGFTTARAASQQKTKAPPPPPGPTGLPNQSDASAAYRERMAEHMARRWDPKRASIPQGESQLVHAWVQLIAIGMPAHACTIWIDCTDQPPYSLEPIPGEWVAGEFPDRELWAYVRQNRRNASRIENFKGRIRGPNTAGVLDDLATGDLRLPAMPQNGPNQQQPPQQQWGGYAGAGPNAWGANGGGWGGAPGGGWGASSASPWGPWGAPPPQWWIAQHWGQQQQQQQPPQAVLDNPALLEIWKLMISGMQKPNGGDDLAKVLLNHLLASKPESARNPMREILELAEVMDKLRPPAQTQAASGMTIHRLEGGTTLVEKADGTLDHNASAILSLLPDVKNVAKGFSVGGMKSLFGSASASAKGASASAGTKPTTTQGTKQ